MLHSSNKLADDLQLGLYSEKLNWLYKSDINLHISRYLHAVEGFTKTFGATDSMGLFSAPGRSEIGGNHTDHQHGRVLAAAVTMDFITAASPIAENEICILSEGFPLCTIDLSTITVVPELYNTSHALISGVVDGFRKRGYKVGGFKAYMTSSVPRGSGLSSSAAYEVMVGTILNYLYNNNEISPVEIAQIGQYSENVFFGKPSGLMDQTASSVGGFVAIDFADTENPVVEQVSCDLGEMGYTLCVINAGGSHADLTPDYSSIPIEMSSVAKFFDKQVLREVDPDEFFANINKLRSAVTDRAILRSIHFFAENDRAKAQADALKNQDIDLFLELIKASASSSQEQLQNIYPLDEKERSVSLALAIASNLLGGRGACRVHGGGFAGTIQAFVPNDMVDNFISGMEDVFGRNCCYRLAIRPVGGYMLEV